MNGNFILRECLCINDCTSSCTESLSQYCLLIFIIARPLSLSAVMVERHDIFTSLSWLKLLSLSQDVMGSVSALEAEEEYEY